jgi:GNAT superfamily N-acetyltransferase
VTDKVLPVVPYDHDKHEGALLRFIKKVLGAEKCALRSKVLESIHLQMPFRDRVPLRHVIVDGDRIAGSMGHLPADFLIQGKIVPARFTHDLLVDPDYRGRGLAKLIVENSHAGGEFLPGGMWMTGACHKIHVACGFKEVKPLTAYTLVLNPASFIAQKGVSKVKGGVGRIGLGFTRARAMNLAKKEMAGGGASLQDIEEFDSSLDPGWMQMAESYKISRVRDAAYLNWKYAAHPNIEYKIIIARRKGKKTGFVIWRNAPKGASEKRAVIVEFLVKNGDVSTLRLMVSKVILEASEAGMDSLSMLTTQPWAANLLRSIGFFPRGIPNSWVVAGWQGHIEPSWFEDHAPWHMCLGDSDGDMWTGSQ